MKNKLIYKYQISGLKDITLTLIFSFLTFIVIAMFISVMHQAGKDVLGYNLYTWLKNIYYMIVRFGDLLNGMFFPILIFLFWYLILTRKKSKQLYKVVESTKDMTVQECYVKLDENVNGEIGQISKNINRIIEALQNSLEEQRILEKTKADLITNVSHDLRTPLTSIIGYLEIIDKDKYKDEVEMKYFVNIAYEKSKSLSILINDLFELNRMRSAKININKEKIDLCELTGQILAEFNLQFKNNNIKVNISFPKEKVIINADSLKLVRAFENLIINAIKYGKDGESIEVKIEDKKDLVEINFQNYGEISPLDLPHVFDRFYRVEKSRSLNLGGSGLGLAITRSIIELHNGSIIVLSDHGKTVFKVRLPKEI